MSFLKRIFGSGPAAPSAAPLLIDVKAFKGRTRTIEIVGESNYEQAIRRAAGPKTPDGVSVNTVADLVPEPNNKYDPNAIAVKVGGQTVGYLSREYAVSFSIAIAEQGYAQHGISGVKAWLHGGWKRPGDEGNYGVTLRVPASIADLMKGPREAISQAVSSPKCLNSVKEDAAGEG